MKTIKLLLIEDNADLSYILKSGPEDVIGGYEVDANNYIKKPYTSEELHVHIKSLFKNEKQLAQHKGEVVKREDILNMFWKRTTVSLLLKASMYLSQN